MERYRGVKFETVFLDRRPPVEAAAHDVVRWARLFQEEGFSPPGESAVGNLSCRLPSGFLITPANVPFAELDVTDLVRVVEVLPEAGRVLVQGTRDPSSETVLHHGVYEARPDVHAVFHGHCAALLEQGPQLGLKTTPREAPYGTRELARLAAEAARDADFFLLRNHGVVALGHSPDQAGQRALDALARVRQAS